MDNIVVVFASDDNYVQHLGVAMVSVLENSSNSSDLMIAVLDGGITEDNKKRLICQANQYKANIEFYLIDQRYFKEFPCDKRISYATYLRITIPSLLDNTFKKAIYLDSDVVVRTDIRKLWEICISGILLGAVEDEVMKNRRNIELGMPSDAKYFNSGVLIINLELWRENDIANKVLSFARENYNKLILHDQDALNAVLTGKWKEIDRTWNIFEENTDSPRKIIIKYWMQLFNRSRGSIIHYVNIVKPWHYMYNNPRKKEYYKYLAISEWKDYQPPDKNMVNFFKKVYLVLMDYPKYIFHLIINTKH